MTDQSDREQESQATEQTKFEREVDAETQRRHETAERLRRDAAGSPDEDTAA